MTVTGAFIGGPANMISAAITADLGRQDVLAASDQALSTVTGIVDGTGSFGAAIGQVLIPLIEKHYDWRFVFYFFVLMVSLFNFFDKEPFICLILRQLSLVFAFYHYLFVNVNYL
jgi:OPA family glycerol-3-phosphate transporter-like MFS transporter 3